MKNDNLGNRMKEYYENISKTKLTRRTPVIIRLDGRAFHTFTKNFKRPFDGVLMKSMQETMLKLCKNIQNAKLGYCQSDEISILMCDYDNFETSAWFDNEVQKICSISASMATLYFNQIFNTIAHEYIDDVNDAWNVSDEEVNYADTLYVAAENGAVFDSRCFNIPKEEVANYFFWRQQDATRNSIQMVGQHYFAHKELQHKSCNDIQNMLLTEKDINWNDYSVVEKRGTCVKRDENNKWVIDKNIPIFKEDGREYIEELI